MSFPVLPSWVLGGPANAVRCQRNKGALQFVLVQQSHIAQFRERRKDERATHIWANSSCLIWTWRLWALPLRRLLLGFWVVPVNPRLISCDYLREFCISFNPLLSILHVLTCSSCSSLSRQNTNLAVTIRSDFPSELSQLTQIIFSTCYQLHGKWLCCVRGKVPSVIHTLICSVCRWASLAIGIFSRGHTGFELWEPLKKNFVMTTAAFPEATINMSKVSITTVRISSHAR